MASLDNSIQIREKILYESGILSNSQRLRGSKFKIDIGLSVNAPNSAIWLEKEPNLVVFGFEPIRSNIERIRLRDTSWATSLNPKMIGNRCFIFPVALSDCPEVAESSIFVTLEDPGCSSLHPPRTFKVERIENVLRASLDYLLAHPIFTEIEYFDHIKIDTQGHDFQVLMGAKNTLHKTLAVTVEMDTTGYVDSLNNRQIVTTYLRKLGFRKVGRFTKLRMKYHRLTTGSIEVRTDDFTFINWSLYKSKKPPKFLVYQSG